MGQDRLPRLLAACSVAPAHLQAAGKPFGFSDPSPAPGPTPSLKTSPPCVPGSCHCGVWAITGPS